MRTRPRDVLFVGPNTQQLMEHQRKLVQASVLELPAAEVLAVDIETLAAKIAEKHSINVPVIDEAEIHVAPQKEVDIDVSRDMNRRFMTGGGGPRHVRGLEITISVPFTGDSAMFQVQPMTFQGGLRGEVRENVLVYKVVGDQLNPTDVRRQFDAWLVSIKQHLEWHQQSLGNFNQDLVSVARNAINQRRTKLSSDRDVVAGLGFPVRR